MLKKTIIISLLSILLLVITSSCKEKEDIMAIIQSFNVPEESADTHNNYQTATFAAGCFWGIQEQFRTTPGVISTSAGYIGGILDSPTYKQVCTDKTGHAEAVEVVYDPDKVTYQQLLDIFWNMHDPTTLNRQGPDVGTQYRSAVFYYSDEQKKLAEASKQKLMQTKKVVTEIVPAGIFWPAEEYHQLYLQKRGITACGTNGH